MTRRLRDWWHRNKHPLQDLLTINHCDCFVFCRCMATLRFITIPWRTLKLRSTLNVRPYQQRGKSNVTECVSNTISIITNPFTNHQLTNSLAKLDGDQTLIVCVILFLFLFVRVCVWNVSDIPIGWFNDNNVSTPKIQIWKKFLFVSFLSTKQITQSNEYFFEKV